MLQRSRCGGISRFRQPYKDVLCVSGAKHGEWFFLKARVALAAAIIKSKPPGMSSREYAEALACKLRSCDEGWKKKGEELQQEVLRLRQELLMSRAAASAAGRTMFSGGVPNIVAGKAHKCPLLMLNYHLILPIIILDFLDECADYFLH